MKIGLLGDLHIRTTKPENRIDDYYNVQFEKLNQAFLHFEKECDLILQPGDFFNNYGKDPYSLLHDTISFLDKYNIPIYIVLGQHDIKFHNLEIKDTPIQILTKTKRTILIPNEGIKINKNIFLYGVSWNQKIPKINPNKSKINILCMHKMTIQDKKSKLWPGQHDFISSTYLCKKYNYDLFVIGDNHNAFIHNSNKSKIINCGSLCRMKMDQTKHKPFYGIYNTKTRKLKTFFYNINPSNKVLRELEIMENKKIKKEQEDFKESLDSDFDGEVNYRNNIRKIMIKKRRIKKRTKELLEEALNEK